MKTIKIKLTEAADAYYALSNIVSKNDFPFEFAWEIEDISEVLEKHTKRFEEARNKLLKEFAKPNGSPGPDGKQSFTVTNQKKFEDGMKELVEIEVEIAFEPISYSKLKSVAGLSVNPQDLTVLKKNFIEKESDNGKAKKADKEDKG